MVEKLFTNLVYKNMIHIRCVINFIIVSKIINSSILESVIQKIPKN